jgi:hypothetical protein
MKASTYTLHTRQELTGEGKLGVWLVLGSPVISALFFGLSTGNRGDAFLLAIIGALCGFAFIAGWVLLLKGRDQITTMSRNVTQQVDHTLWR